MTNRCIRLLASVTIVVSLAAPAAAANKEHQQLMADIRMLQEQAQLLQNMLGTLTDTLKDGLKTVNARIDQQAEANRRTSADEKLLLDTLAKDLGVVREKIDDSNVRVGSLAQEVDALRKLVQQALARTPATTELDPGAPPPVGAPAPPPSPAPSPAVGASPTKTYDQAFGDYAAGLWDLAIDGFEAFLRAFPKSDKADDAQFHIGRAYLNDAKYDKAVEAFDKVIRTYPASSSVPDSFYLKGVALRSLRQTDRAREAWQTVVKTYPDSPASSLAKQALGP